LPPRLESGGAVHGNPNDFIARFDTTALPNGAIAGTLGQPIIIVIPK
jgi:hypothetical protein